MEDLCEVFALEMGLLFKRCQVGLDFQASDRTSIKAGLEAKMFK